MRGYRRWGRYWKMIDEYHAIFLSVFAQDGGPNVSSPDINQESLGLNISEVEVAVVRSIPRLWSGLFRYLTLGSNTYVTYSKNFHQSPGPDCLWHEFKKFWPAIS